MIVFTQKNSSSIMARTLLTFRIATVLQGGAEVAGDTHSSIIDLQLDVGAGDKADMVGKMINSSIFTSDVLVY